MLLATSTYDVEVRFAEDADQAVLAAICTADAARRGRPGLVDASMLGEEIAGRCASRLIVIERRRQTVGAIRFWQHHRLVDAPLLQCLRSQRLPDARIASQAVLLVVNDCFHDGHPAVWAAAVEGDSAIEVVFDRAGFTHQRLIPSQARRGPFGGRVKLGINLFRLTIDDDTRPDPHGDHEYEIDSDAAAEFDLDNPLIGLHVPHRRVPTPSFREQGY